MEKKKDGWSRIYRPFNLAMVGFEIYALLLPFFSPFMGRFFPNLWKCSYNRITGNPCPLCGMTRDFRDLLSGSRGVLNSMSFWALLFVISSLVYRGWVCRCIDKFTQAKRRTLFLFDLSVHVLLILVLVLITIGRRDFS